jgi:hypothetical protein
MQNQIEPTERELKIINYGPKTIKSYIYGLKEYFAFKKKDFENRSDPFGPACLPASRQAGRQVGRFQVFRSAFSGTPKRSLSRIYCGARFGSGYFHITSTFRQR